MSSHPTLTLRHPEPDVRAANDAAALFSPEKARSYAAMLVRCNVDEGANLVDPANWKSAPAYSRWMALCDALDGNLAGLGNIPQHQWDTSTDLTVKRFEGRWVIYRRSPKGYRRGGNRLPRFHHKTFDAAAAEAGRLARQHPESTFVILQEQAVVKIGDVA